MKNFWSTFLACLLAVVASGILFIIMSFMMLGAMMAVFSSGSAPTLVADHSVLKLDLSGRIVDHPSKNPFSSFDPTTMSLGHDLALIDVLQTIERAAEDPKIDGIYLNTSEISMGMAAMEEVRAELVKFRESGKFILSYADYYSQGTYYLASTADRIYVNPEGGFDWRGLASRSIFLKGAMDKLGIQAEIFRVGDFKSAVEPFMLDKMSPENREQTQVMISGIWNNIVNEIAASRNLTAETLQTYASDLAVTNPAKAVELGLVDATKYKDEVLAELLEKTGLEADDEPNFVSLPEYMAVPVKASGRLSKNKIALIYAEGDIVEGTETDGIIGGEGMADKLAEVRMDDDIKAVVLRVNSPGGSALASELIWREMTLLRAEKPVIVSMGDYAASGGYYISAPADVILANKHTLTGSIGVFGILPNVGTALRDKVGVTTDVVRTNPSADMGDIFRLTTPAERAFIQNGVEDVYRTFTGHVAEGRNLPVEEVLKIAGGRVWSGVSAMEIGLVDGFGGLKAAVELAADRAGVGEDYRVVSPEEPVSPMDQLLGSFLSARIRKPGLSAAEQELLNEFRNVKRIMETEGIQARMPYTYEIR